MRKLTKLLGFAPPKKEKFFKITFKKEFDEKAPKDQGSCWNLDPVFPYTFIIESYEQFFGKDVEKKSYPIKNLTAQEKDENKIYPKAIFDDAIKLYPGRRKELQDFDEALVNDRSKTALVNITPGTWWDLSYRYREGPIEMGLDRYDFMSLVLGFQPRLQHMRLISKGFDEANVQKKDFDAHQKNFRFLGRLGTVFCSYATTYDVLYSLLVEYLICSLSGSYEYTEFIENLMMDRLLPNGERDDTLLKKVLEKLLQEQPCEGLLKFAHVDKWSLGQVARVCEAKDACLPPGADSQRLALLEFLKKFTMQYLHDFDGYITYVQIKPLAKKLVDEISSNASKGAAQNLWATICSLIETT